MVCLVHCETVKLNEDFTVEYMFYRYFDGNSLSYKGILKGNWEVIGKDRIQIKAIDKKFKESLQSAFEEDEMFIDPVYPPEIDFTFIVKRKKLQKLFNSNVEYTLKKLNRKESQKLFSTN